ncbi:hypothetical protein T439DRAFT_323368 [Meredithblackwellia eburnea MCA 4105]
MAHTTSSSSAPSLHLRALLIDLSGTVHVGDQPTPGAVEAINQLRSAGIAVRFVSNTSKESKSSLLSKMSKMDLDVREEELYTSLSAVSEIVKSRDLKPLYILSPSALSDFPVVPPSTALDSVVVGLAPDRLEYQTLNQAFRLLLSPEDEATPAAKLIATHKASYYRSSDGGLSLGPGPFITGLEEASGVTAEVVGKPTRTFYEIALKSLEKDGISSTEWDKVGMIGDDKKQDVGLVPSEIGLKRFLVQTGKYRKGDENKTDAGGKPDWCGPNFAEAVKDILKQL